MTALEDPETQIKGIVMLPWGLPRGPPWDAWKVNALMSTMPYCIKGWHTILVDSVSPLFSWLLSLLDSKTRLRMRMHNGTHQEILYSVRERDDLTIFLLLVGRLVALQTAITDCYQHRLCSHESIYFTV